MSLKVSPPKMSLFDSGDRGINPADLPLASRMRPQTLEEYVGQEHLLAAGSAIEQAIRQGKLGSVVLWAPPGCGKTTLANIIAHYSDSVLISMSAVTAGVADIRKAASEAKSRYQLTQKTTLLLVDEIHHFNKSQQDSLLGYLEDGTFRFIGATTENPYFALNDALLSRARVLPLKPLEPKHLADLIQSALTDEVRGVGSSHCTIEPEAVEFLLQISNGDARLLLNALETGVMMTEAGTAVTLSTLEQVLQRQSIRYDKKGDCHYDTISAFIKSIRGSDADAALHYLARMIEAGEDPRFIVRRLIILASEDIGNAEPQGLILASAALTAVATVGMPESRIILAQLVTFLAEAPKSNRAYLAIDKAIADIKAGKLPPVPLNLRNAAHSGMKEHGYGKGYQYPHDDPRGWVDAEYLPKNSGLSTPYYEPSDHGYESKIKERRSRRK
jgi:putative ATPase